MEKYSNNAKAASSISGSGILKSLGLWVVLGAVIGIASWYAAASLEPSSWKAAQIPTVLVVAEAYGLLPIAIFLRFGGLSGLRDRVKLRYTGMKDVGLSVAVFIGLAAVLFLLYLAMGAVSGSLWHPAKALIHDATDMSRLPTANALTWILILVRVLLLAGLAEELLFRGLLFGWLRQKYTAVPTILITAALFSAEHYYPIILPAVFVIGVTLGWLRERTGSVLPGLIVHILTDTSMLLIAYLLVAHHIT